jgi:hypothetical protein
MVSTRLTRHAGHGCRDAKGIDGRGHRGAARAKVSFRTRCREIALVPPDAVRQLDDVLTSAHFLGGAAALGVVVHSRMAWAPGRSM